MKKIHSFLLMVVVIGLSYSTAISQNIQKFGPGVHQDLDHRIETRRICVPSPTSDYGYDFNKSFETNVNEAIQRERLAFGASKIADYVHPSYYTDPVDYAHKIITALRKAYSQAYDISVIDIELNAGVINASQNHSCKMISCNQFTHQSTCTGSPKTRLEAQVGQWGSCLTGYSENIAINTANTIEGAMEWAIFGMMYDDLACCQNGHRENFLKCTYDDSWKMGFGYKKGKYSFGSSRSYDTWFMTWDYAKQGGTSGCGWESDNGAKECPVVQIVEMNNLNVTGEGECSNLLTSWSAANTTNVQVFEVYQSTDGKTYSVVATITPQSENNYSASFSTSGTEAKIFVKAVTKEGGFYSSELFVFDVSNCKPSDDIVAPDVTVPETTEPDIPGEDVTDNSNPPVSQPETKPTPEPEVDPTKIIIIPNPAVDYIKLKDVPYGSVYRISTMEGKPVQYGLYLNTIQLTWLRPGSYVITVDGRSGQFVKM